MEDQFIPREVMEDRLKRLQDRVAVHQLAFNRATVGHDTRLLLERKGRRPGQMIGRSPWLQSVHVETDAQAGDMIDVTLVSAGPNSMAGATLARAAA
jgi:tRNA-2-methylthio-N6-dimethylallyladenosine synthase